MPAANTHRLHPLPTPLYRTAEVRALERHAIEELGIAGYALMERAGQAAFHALRERWPQAERIALVCGPGNNGGDGLVVARLARVAGIEARVLQVGDPARRAAEASRAAEEWLGYGGEIHPFDAARLDGVDVVVDALFGIGLERETAGEWREAIAAVNRCGRPVLALDIPSGLHADSGAVLGEAVRAELTVTFLALKRGLFTGAAADHCGTILFHPLDLPAEPPRAVAATAERLIAAAPPPRLRTAHKGQFGHLLVVGGENGFGGAPRLAGEAALRCGAGLVSVATRTVHAAPIAAARPELMCHGVESGKGLQPLLEAVTVVAVGPGLGRLSWGHGLFAAVLGSGKPLVVDADALNLLAEHPLRRPGWVLTPHPGEAGRLLGASAATVQADRFAAVEELQRRYGGVAVLKGSGTLVADGEGPVGVCGGGNPGMATAGMGDLLTGVIGALLAQGLTAVEAARRGVCLHAAAADRAAAAGERGMVASDLLPELRRLVNGG